MRLHLPQGRYSSCGQENILALLRIEAMPSSPKPKLYRLTPRRLPNSRLCPSITSEFAEEYNGNPRSVYADCWQRFEPVRALYLFTALTLNKPARNISLKLIESQHYEHLSIHWHIHQLLEEWCWCVEEEIWKEISDSVSSEARPQKRSLRLVSAESSLHILRPQIQEGEQCSLIQGRFGCRSLCSRLRWEYFQTM
jgi:hypothetical protein